MAAVLRIYHSGVVTAWRARDRNLRDLGHDITLVTAQRWNEGGRDVRFDPGDDDFVVPARTSGRHPYRFVYDPRPLIREMRRRRLAVIDVHEEPASLAALEVRVLARMFQRGVPMLFYGAQNIEKRFPVPFRWIERGSLRMAAGVYCCNEDAARIFASKGLRGLQRVIGLGVDVERFGPADHTSEHEYLRLGYVGRLEPRKGVGVLIEAIATIPRVSLDIFGDGSAATNLRVQVDRLQLGDRVTFHGHAAHDDLPDVYRTFDAIAVPSLRTPQWMEQFGRVAIEAMASGVPVIASDEGSLREVVDDAGVLVPPGDVERWREAITSLRDDTERRRQLACAGRERAQSYSWPAIARAHSELYREVGA